MGGIIIKNEGGLLQIKKTTSKSIIWQEVFIFLVMMIICFYNDTPKFVVLIFGIAFVGLLYYNLKIDIVEINLIKSDIRRYSTVFSKQFKYDFIYKLQEPLTLCSVTTSDSDGLYIEFYFILHEKKISLFDTKESESIKTMNDFFKTNQIIFNGQAIQFLKD